MTGSGFPWYISILIRWPTSTSLPCGEGGRLAYLDQFGQKDWRGLRLHILSWCWCFPCFAEGLWKEQSHHRRITFVVIVALGSNSTISGPEPSCSANLNDLNDFVVRLVLNHPVLTSQQFSFLLTYYDHEIRPLKSSLELLNPQNESKIGSHLHLRGNLSATYGINGKCADRCTAPFRHPMLHVSSSWRLLFRWSLSRLPWTDNSKMFSPQCFFPPELFDMGDIFASTTRTA